MKVTSHKGECDGEDDEREVGKGCWRGRQKGKIFFSGREDRRAARGN